MTDIWFRNPHQSFTILVQEGVTRITWTRQHIQRMRMDGLMLTRQFYMHTPLRPKIMLIGIQGSAEYGIFDRYDKPQAVYPTWSGKGDTWDDLLDLIENPVGESEEKCSDPNLPTALRPVLGQKHRVVIHNNPRSSSGWGQRFWIDLAQVQIDYPEVELFINGSSSYSIIFGLKFRAADWGMNDLGDSNQQLILPNGAYLKLARSSATAKLLQWSDWLAQVGLSVNDIVKDTDKARARLKVRSAKWAAKHWYSNYRFSRDDSKKSVDSDSSDEDFVPPESHQIVLRRKQVTTRDAEKLLCDRCVLAPRCTVYRSQSVCGLKESEVGDLSEFFQSRHAGKIIDGLAEITKLQARRVDAAIDVEAATGETDPDVTRQLNSLFANGVKLAKLVNPDLNGKGTNVQVNVGVSGGNAEIVSMTNPKEVMAGIVAMLEANGIDRDNITPDMVEGVLRGMTGATTQQAIEAQVIKAQDVLGKKIDMSKVYVEPEIISTSRDS